ncbi:hypothetical protein Hdeb2414_s0010g00347851 [Helianthus debilis subsp. tardiflorus]
MKNGTHWNTSEPPEIGEQTGKSSRRRKTSKFSVRLFRIITLARSLGSFSQSYSYVIYKKPQRNQCEYTRSLFPLYTLGCNMYNYANIFKLN